jgi:hypothetical protein
VTLSGGQATFTYPGTTTGGTHVVVAAYSGDSNYFASRGTVTLTLAGSALATGNFTLSATAASLPYNGTGTSTVTVAPLSGYTGQVEFTLSSSSSLTNFCYAVDPVAAYNGAATKPLSSTLTIGQGTACSGGSTITGASGMKRIGSTNVSHQDTKPLPWRRPAETALAGLLLGAVLLPRRLRRMPSLLGVVLLGTVAMGLSGCGGSGNSSTTTTSTNTTQTYTMTLTGVDSVTSSITSSTTFSVTVHP